MAGLPSPTTWRRWAPPPAPSGSIFRVSLAASARMTRRAEALFLVTEWNEFRQPDFARVKQLMANPVVFDGRNIWNPQRLAELGFTYHGVGRRRASEQR